MLRSFNRREFLWTASGAVALPITGIGAIPALAARDEVIVRFEYDISNLDPAFRTGSVEDNILLACCQTLARFNPGKLEWSNDAAKTLTQVSETEIDFELNPGQMFHGGYGEMTAEDVKFSLERFIKPDASGKKAAYADDFAALDRVEVTGTYTGKLMLKNPAPAFWVIGLCDGSGSILSKKAVEALGDKIATTLIGSGPYRVKDWKPKEQIVLEADPDAKTIKLDGIDYTWLGINVEKPPFNDIKVRQAIRLGVDVDAIIAGAYSGTVTRAKTLLAPGLLGHWADAPLYPHDPEKAKALLAEAGQSSFTTTLTCLNDATAQAVAQIIQANLGEIGITVTINALDSGAYWALGEGDKSKDLDLTIIPYSSKFDPGFQTQWFVSAQVGVWNWQRWKNEEFDKLHAEANATTDNDKREKMYVRMQQLLDESASCIWITHGVHDFAHAKWLSPAILPNGNNWQFRFFKEA